MPDPKTPDTTTPKRTRRSRGESANSQTINLMSGGSVTLSGTNINPFTMTPTDLAFVTELAQKLRSYSDVLKEATKTAAPAAVRPTVVPPVSTNVGNPGTQKPS